ncbi:putative Peroxiredoxin Q, chloroplastic [Cocos nucifera]|uniref:thioredoxin-dependent peroxiredoxin n=1 Tax=Cocos nucifera TaxID=13894 RepID=A0A8K0I299_COCNU|nr:putative Peroxiredoxin Q, chloroplastic [Cocos nucifera]
MERVRPARRLWRGNRGLYDELVTKLNELEGLLAAHKMASPSWRTRAGDLQLDRLHKARERRPAPDRSPEIGNAVDFDGNLALSIRDDQGCSYHTKKSEGLRGRLYEKYMEKRDAKLREEWGLRRTYKEAKMKAMWDSLEQSQAELKARFGRSDERRDLAFQDFRHAEKLKSFGARSGLKDTEQQTVEFIQTKEEENLEQKVQYVQFKFYDDTRLNDDSSSSTDSKKLFSSRSVASSTSQKSVAPIPRSPINSGSIRRRTHPENPQDQSVSNNSHHRKENMKPLTGTSKITGPSRSWTHARSVSISEGVHIVKEEKPPRSKSMRNVSISSGELKDLSSVNTSIPRPTPSRFSKKQSEQTTNRKIRESKPFLRRGNGIGPGAGAAIARSRTCIASEMQTSGEESEGLVGQCECSPDTVKYKDEQELGRTSSEGRETGFPSDSDGGKSRYSQELGSIGDPRPGDGDDFAPISKADDDDSPTASKFISSASEGSMEELQEQNPGSWNSPIKYPHSNSHEASDVNASVAMNQTQEADPARARKKWKKAEKLVLATNASHQPRNGVAEGFKRLFKFGKKRKGAESIINVTVSVSAASGVGDDVENGRDLASQSSDDLRKLRMDYSVPAYHGPNEGKVFPDQVPSLHRSSPGAPANSILKEDRISGSSPKAHRPMFSIPSFHSKGSKSKLRKHFIFREALTLHKAKLNLHFIPLELIKSCREADENSPLVLGLHSISSFSLVSKGDVPPPFTLKDQNGRNVSLTRFKGRPVVVYFYPADETPGCTKEACAFRDSYEKFKKARAEVVGISGDDPASHKAFATKYGLPFTLLSDEGNMVRKEWGVPSDLFGVLPGRQTYVIDRNGVVQLVYNNQFQPEKHVEETLKLLQSL